MQIVPIHPLFVDVTDTPDYYWLEVEIPQNDGYDIVSHDPVVEILAENKFVVNINIEPSSGSGSRKKDVHLGDLDADPVPKVIEVNLIDVTETATGNGTVSTEEAQQETRPIGLGDLPE